MVLRVLAWAIALGIAAAASQAADGQIAGRISDTAGAPLPGVRITIANGGQSRAVVTDGDGRFVLSPAATGTYRVTADLAGFVSTSGNITLSSSSPRAFLAWRLGVGCLSDEDLRVILGARKSAPMVDAILHVRVTSADGPVLMSQRPECDPRVLQEYSVQILGSAPRDSRTVSGSRALFMSQGDARLDSDQEYLVLLWPGERATGDLVFPIVSGRVASPSAAELNGMRVEEALALLGTWARERRP